MRSRMAGAIVAALVATTCGTSTDAPGGSSPPVTASATAVAASPTASASTSPTARPNPTSGPGTYTSVGLGYSLRLPAGWRRSECGSVPGQVPQIPGGESFTPAGVNEESGSDMGPDQEVVAVHVESEGTTSPERWFQDRVFGGLTERVELARIDGKDGYRVMNGDTGLVLGYALASGGRLYALWRSSASILGSNSYDAAATALMESFHVLTDAERLAAQSTLATPSPAPVRTADELVQALIRGFAQKDTRLLAEIASPCLTHAREQAGPNWGTSTKMLADIDAAFARGTVVALSATIKHGPWAENYVDATWDDPSDPARPRKNVQVWIAPLGSTWYWTGWMDPLPVWW